MNQNYPQVIDDFCATLKGFCAAVSAPQQAPQPQTAPVQPAPTLPMCNVASFAGPSWNDLMNTLAQQVASGQVSPLALQALMPHLTQVAPRIDGVTPTVQ